MAAVLAGALPAPGVAAPLDALLSAVPERAAPRGLVEAGASVVNRHIDFSDPEDDPELAARAARGDYQDLLLNAAWAPAPGWWLSGGVAQRRVSDGVDRYRYLGWQVAAQRRLREADATGPAIALRVAAWGHHASRTETTSPVRVPGAILDSVTVESPGDRSLQADLVASWVLAPTLEVSALAGAGFTQLSYGGLRATTTRNGCRYDLQFSGNDIFGTLAEPCSAPGGVIEQFFDSSGSYGVDVAREIAWRGRFVQAGVNLRWQRGDWRLAAGWLLHAVKREGVDEILASRGRPVVDRNQLIVLDGEFQVRPGLGLFARAQLGQRLFFNDIPVTYNSSTSGSFRGRLSLFTLGLRARF